MGSLSIVKSLSATVSTDRGKIDRVWQINNSEKVYNYPKEYHVKLGKSLSIPIDPDWTLQDFTLLRTFDKYHSDDYSSRLKI